MTKINTKIAPLINNKITSNVPEISKVLVASIASIIIFYTFNPFFIVYFLFMIIFWSILLLNFKVDKNSRFFLSMWTISIVNLGILIFMKHIVHNTLHKNWINIVLFIVYATLLLIGVIYFYSKLERAEVYRTEVKEIYSGREYDLKRIEDYLERVNSIGVNGAWGSGKTFLVNKLKDIHMNSDQYIFIEVDLLSSNLDEIESVVLSEMERVLSTHRILPRYSTKLKRIFQDNSFVRNFSMLFIKEEMSYAEILKGFIEEVNKLNQTIIIVYEDIDRINDLTDIKKIFNISEKLVGRNIKVIYQYETSNLIALGLERNFLEKYIAYTINLTPVKFIEILESIITDVKLLQLENFKHLINPIFLDDYLRNELALETINISIDNLPIRKVESFIEELEIILKENIELYQEGVYKRVAINFHFIKHFYYELYEMFNLKDGLLDTIKFVHNKSEYSFPELIAKRKLSESGDVNKGLSEKDFRQVFRLPENEEKLFLLMLFEYDVDTEEIHRNNRGIRRGSLKKISNEKKDRLIWNILAKGKSEYTDYELAAEKLIENVLTRPEPDQFDAYKAFKDDMYHGNFKKKDNTTPFKFGIPEFPTLVEALRASYVETKYWKQFISFYLRYTEKKVIDRELILILSYFPLDSRETYLYLLSCFNDLEIEGNMNTQSVYLAFIGNYLSALSTLGYVNTYSLRNLETYKGTRITTEIIDYVINPVKNEVLSLKKSINYSKIKTELDQIVEFIDKNIEIINCEKPLTDSQFKSTTELRSEFVNQEEFDRLAELKEVSEEEFTIELEKSYEDERIFPSEVDELLKN